MFPFYFFLTFFFSGYPCFFFFWYWFFLFLGFGRFFLITPAPMVSFDANRDRFDFFCPFSFCGRPRTELWPFIIFLVSSSVSSFVFPPFSS